MRKRMALSAPRAEMAGLEVGLCLDVCVKGRQESNLRLASEGTSQTNAPRPLGAQKSKSILLSVPKDH